MILDKYELTEDAILNGDFAEFEPVANNRKEKRETYLSEAVDTVVKDTFEDLRNTLEEKNELKSEVERLNGELEESARLVQQARADSGIKQSDVAQLKRAENVLADLEHQVEQFKQKRQEDARRISELEQQLSMRNNSSDKDAEIESLRDKVSELEERDAERDSDYQRLADDVNDVLDSLEARFSDLTVEA